MKNKFHREKISKALKFWLSLLIGLLFLYLAFKNVDLGKTFELIRNAALLPIFMSLAVRGTGLWVRSKRWQILLKPVKSTSSLNLFRILSVAEMGNYLLPARIGEVIRIVMVAKKEAISKASALASVFVDRFLDLLALLILLASLSFLFDFPDLIQKGCMIAAGFLAVITMVCILLLRFNEFFEKIANRFLAKTPKVLIKFEEGMHRFLDGLVIMRQTRQMVQATLISLFLWLSYGFAFYLVLVSLNIDLPWYAAFVVAATVGLAEAIPSTAGYVGTFEFFAVAALAVFSIEKSIVLAFVLIAHALQYITVISMGLISYFWLNLQFSDLKSPSQPLSLAENK